MSFGSRLKEKRESLGITQPQLAKLLNVSKGAIGNWETDVNSPRATLLCDLFDILHCDANYLFQDETKDLYKDEAIPEEFEKIIKKYRTLDTYGKDAVDSVLDIEYTRCQVKEEPSSYIPDNIRPIDYYMKNASAGSGQVVFDDTVVERITIPDILTSQKNCDNVYSRSEKLRKKKGGASLAVIEANEPLATGINRIIASKGLKKIHVAKEAGLSPQELSDMLNGRRLIKACDIPNIAKALHVDTDDIYKAGTESRE